LLASTAETHEARKLVSVLFVDMVGSTGRADGADPEAVRDVLRRSLVRELV
jgi:class 3 adenylate cyclase